MAYLMTHFWPGGTEEQYRAMLGTVHPPGGLPEGQVYHAGGPTEGGFLIAVVWDSKESADRFVSDVLLASMPVDGGFAGSPEERTAEVANLETATAAGAS
jgi:hypothetical protein